MSAKHNLDCDFTNFYLFDIFLSLNLFKASSSDIRDGNKNRGDFYFSRFEAGKR